MTMGPKPLILCALQRVPGGRCGDVEALRSVKHYLSGRKGVWGDVVYMAADGYLEE